MRDVGLDRILTDVLYRTDTDRPEQRLTPDQNARVRIRIGRCEPHTVASLEQSEQHKLVRVRLARRDGRHFDRRPLEAAEPVERVAEPGAVVDPVPHRFAELAVTRNVDAGLPLATDHIDNRALQQFLKARLIHSLPGRALAIGLDQVVRPRQASDVAGEDVIAAVAHAACSRLRRVILPGV